MPLISMYHHPQTPRLAEHQLSFISVNNRELILNFLDEHFDFFKIDYFGCSIIM